MRLSLCLVVALTCLAFHAFAQENSGNVSANDFEGVMTVSMKDFLGLAEKWDDRAKAADRVASNPTVRGDEFNYALGEKQAYERASEELRQAIKKEQAKVAKTDAEADLFWDAKQGREFEVAAVQEQGFGQQPTQPQTDIRPQSSIGPGQPPVQVPTQNHAGGAVPTKWPTASQYTQVPQYSHGAASCGAGTTYRVQQTYSSGSRWRLFGRRGGRLFGRFRGC